VAAEPAGTVPAAYAYSPACEIPRMFPSESLNQADLRPSGKVMTPSTVRKSSPKSWSSYVRTWEAALARGVRGADASLVLEDNVRMRGALEKLGARIYQTYRIYEYQLDGNQGAPRERPAQPA